VDSIGLDWIGLDYLIAIEVGRGAWCQNPEQDMAGSDWTTKQLDTSNNGL